MKRLVLAAVLVSISACKKPAAAATSDAGPEAQAPAAATGWNEARVKKYLEFQHAFLALYARPVAADGGLGPAPHLSDEALAAQEASLRRSSGLTDEEIDVLTQLSATLLTRDVMQKVAELTAMKNELTKARAEVPDGSVPEVDAALEVIAERKKRQAAYLEERQRFGDALIDAALPHEQELMANWAAMMDSGRGMGAARE